MDGWWCVRYSSALNALLAFDTLVALVLCVLIGITATAWWFDPYGHGAAASIGARLILLGCAAVFAKVLVLRWLGLSVLKWIGNNLREPGKP